jgi:hypothetical protein
MHIYHLSCIFCMLALPGLWRVGDVTSNISIKLKIFFVSKKGGDGKKIHKKSYNFYQGLSTWMLLVSTISIVVKRRFTNLLGLEKVKPSQGGIGGEFVSFLLVTHLFL